MEFLAASASASSSLDWLDFAWIAFSAVIFAFLLRRVAQQGGRVEISGYGSTENWIAGSLGCWFLVVGATVYLNNQPAPTTKMGINDLVAFTAMSVLFISIVVMALKNRGRNLDELFGFKRQPVWKALVFALVFMFASYPVVSAGALLTQNLSKGPEDLQELVKFFRDASRIQDRLAVIISAVVVAPFAEELFFRGIIYGVAKRYGGMWAAVVFNAAFFAFIHGSLPALGGLFALAVCLTLAYEFTGSLYVPIFMHASFNAAELVFIFSDKT